MPKDEEGPDPYETAMLEEDFKLFVDLYQFVTDPDGSNPSDEEGDDLLERFRASDFDSAKRI